MYVRELIKVYNGCLLQPPPNLEVNGFQLVDANTQVRNLHDQDAVTTHFYQECSDLITAITGCSDTRVMQHQYRNGFGDFLTDTHAETNLPQMEAKARMVASIQMSVPTLKMGLKRLLMEGTFRCIMCGGAPTWSRTSSSCHSLSVTSQQLPQGI